MLANSDGEVEIDLPDDAVCAATVAAHEAAGLIARPHIDSATAESTVEGDTRTYTKAPFRAIILSATDAREGWPAPELIATKDELARASAPRARERRLWL